MARKTTKRRASMRDRVRQRALRSVSANARLYSLPSHVSFFKEKAGTINLDILPYEVTDPHHLDEVPVGELAYCRTVWVHKNVGVDNRSIICLAKMWKEACPICEELEALKNEGDPSKEKTIKNMYPKRREIYNLVHPTAPEKFMVWDISYHTFGKELERDMTLAKDDDPKLGFPDMEGGSTLQVQFVDEPFQTADGKGGTFVKTHRIDYVSREEYDESILQKVVNLDECVNRPSYDDVVRMVFGGDEEEEAGEVPVDEGKSEPAQNLENAPQSISQTTNSPSEPEEEEQSEELAKEASEAEKPTKEEPEVEEGTCPSGHEWAVDCDSTDACSDCDVWRPCFDEQTARGISPKLG
tara:strand:- start:275 stop:1339 length:1065 start_codon:yes stop_codon:yes gene_type:complete